MTVAEIIQNQKQTAFSIELLPPLKGNNINKVFSTIELLKEFNPIYVNITSHRDEVVYKTTDKGFFQRSVQIRDRNTRLFRYHNRHRAFPEIRVRHADHR